MTMFFVFVIAAGYIFSYAFGDSIILFFAVIFSILMSFFSYWYSDKLVLKISGAREVKFEENKELYRLVENLCITAGLPTPKIYIIEDRSPNAFATGRNSEHAVIAVTSGLLGILDRSELEGVIAHELSHIGNRDILLSTIIVVLVGFVALLSDWFLRWTFWGGRRSRDNDNGGANLMFILALVFAILAPISATLMQLAISQKREFLADADGALLTRYPEGLANALQKISAQAIPVRNANKATAHLYISDPYKGKKTGFLTKMFMTHPPVEERVAALLGEKK